LIFNQLSCQIQTLRFFEQTEKYAFRLLQVLAL